jgi:hypothetical protein
MGKEGKGREQKMGTEDRKLEYYLGRFPPKNLPADSGEIPDLSGEVGDLWRDLLL